MTLMPYRRVLALPGVRSLLLVSLLARIPGVATSIVLTLYVVLTLDRGYAAAGLVGTTMTVGMALGAPLLGRFVDRRGLRPMLVLTTVAEAVFWLAAPTMSYPVLLVTAFFGGLLTLPVFSVVRQSIAALVPAEQRRPAYALDSISVDVSFMVGPALAVLVSTALSPRVTMLAVGAGVVLAGIALFILDPPVRTAADPEPLTGRPPRREWLTGRLVGVLAGAMAATLVLGGTDVAVVAALRAADELSWTGPVLAFWGLCSMLGGFTYGLAPRTYPPLPLALLLCLTTIPVGLGSGQWWLLALVLIPAGLLCAPTLSATSDAVSRLAPASVRGEAMGLHGSSLTVGLALGAPLAGAVIDRFGAAWGFAATGLAGVLLTLVILPVELRRRSATVVPSGASVTPVGGR